MAATVAAAPVVVVAAAAAAITTTTISPAFMPEGASHCDAPPTVLRTTPDHQEAMSIMSIANRLHTYLYRPVSIVPLVLFRVAFGAIMIWEVWRYFHYDRVERYYMRPLTFFPYRGFEWLAPLPGDGMTWLFYGLALLSACIMVGLFYRASAILFFLTFTYIFLLDQAQYLNHFYLISLVSFILIFISPHRAYAVDAWLGLAQRSTFVPAWSLNWLRFQIAVPYIYGGIAKLNSDWLQGQPMGMWLAARTDFPIIGRWFTADWAGQAFSYGGLLLDLLFVPLVLWHRTRWLAMVAVTVFHFTNARLFNIGIFPWMMLAATVVFLPEAWFRRQTAPPIDRRHRLPRVLLGGLALYIVLQLLMPLRHLAYPSDPSWSEAGHMFAWHMRLRSKDADTRFFAYTTESGRFWEVDATPYLTPRQHQQMADHPEMIRHFARFLGDDLQNTYGEPVAVYAWAMVSLNGRPPQLMVDPSVDLTQSALTWGENDWVLPLYQRNIGHPSEPPLLLLYREDYTAAINIGDDYVAAVDYLLAPGECVLWARPEANVPVLPCNALASLVTASPPTLTGDDLACVGGGATCVAGSAHLSTTLTWHDTQR
ncbi:MAG: HTTM domain-containing protein [Chloroflexota bacterium]